MNGGPFSRLDLDTIESRVEKYGYDALSPGDTLRLVREVRRLWNKVESLQSDSDLLNGLIGMIADSTGVEIKGKFPGVWQVGVFNAKGEYSLFARSGCDIRSAIEAAIKKWSEKE